MMWRLAFWWRGWRYHRGWRPAAVCGPECAREPGHFGVHIRADGAEWGYVPDLADPWEEQDFYGSMSAADEWAWQREQRLHDTIMRDLAEGPPEVSGFAFTTYLPAPEVAHSGWWGQTAADLAPEALALAPEDSWHDGGWLCGPGQPQERKRSLGNENRDRDTDSGPGDSVEEGSLTPGPDLGRLAWLDRQLASHAEWARRMRGQVTGWGLEAAA